MVLTLEWWNVGKFGGQNPPFAGADKTFRINVGRMILKLAHCNLPPYFLLCVNSNSVTTTKKFPNSIFLMEHLLHVFRAISRASCKLSCHVSLCLPMDTDNLSDWFHVYGTMRCCHVKVAVLYARWTRWSGKSAMQVWFPLPLPQSVRSNVKSTANSGFSVVSGQEACSDRLPSCQASDA